MKKGSTRCGAAALPPTQTPGGAIGEMLFGRSSTRNTDIAVDVQGGIQSAAVCPNPRFPDDPPALLNPSLAPDGG